MLVWRPLCAAMKVRAASRRAPGGRGQRGARWTWAPGLLASRVRPLTARRSPGALRRPPALPAPRARALPARAQLNLAYPVTGCQKMIDIEDDKKLCAPRGTANHAPRDSAGRPYRVAP